MKRLGAIFFNLILLSIVTSCNNTQEENGIDPTIEENIQDLVIDASFEFKTEREINLVINNAGCAKVVYKVYADFENESSHLIATGAPHDGVFKTTVIVPDFCQQLKVVKNDNGKESTQYYAANGTLINNSGARAANTGCSDKLYAVNGNGNFFTIDLDDGAYSETLLPNLAGGGSIACAVDKENNKIYYNTGKTLRYYNLNDGNFYEAQTGNPFNGSYPRMEYDKTSGLLYIASNQVMYSVNPLTNEVVQRYDIVGLQNPVSGGDLAISKEGVMYMCCFSGLYRIEINGSVANATRISAENFPYSPTSMAIDRNDRLYIATNDANSHLIEMDKNDGAWNIVKTFTRKINDLGSFKCDLAELPDVDTDQDGIIDAQDDYPEDAEAAFNVFTPSDIGWGSLAFEDLWPNQGDYDFNDLVVSYRFTQIENADNEVVRLNAKFKVKAIGAGFHNGFGFKMDIDPALISSVTGNNLTNNIISTESNGLESGHSSGSTIIVFDDAYKNAPAPGQGFFVNTELNAPHVEADEIDILIEFTNPVSSSVIGSPPYNPFIFIRGDRGREVHLANKAPTDLANPTFFNSEDDNSVPNEGKYYRTENNLPWAINIIHEFRHPIERTAINKGYNRFSEWARGSGNNYKDWYKDNSGYRNINRLYIR